MNKLTIRPLGHHVTNCRNSGKHDMTCAEETERVSDQESIGMAMAPDDLEASMHQIVQQQTQYAGKEL